MTDSFYRLPVGAFCFSAYAAEAMKRSRNVSGDPSPADSIDDRTAHREEPPCLTYFVLLFSTVLFVIGGVLADAGSRT